MFLIPIMVQNTPENFDNDGSDNNQSLEDTSLERETSDAGVSQK